MDVTEEIDDMKEEEMEEGDIDDEESSESSGDEVSDDEDIVNKGKNYQNYFDDHSNFQTSLFHATPISSNTSVCQRPCLSRHS